MKLHSFDGEILVPEPHDFILISPRGDLKLGRHRVAIDDQRVVASCCQRARQVGEHASTFVQDRGSAAVHEPICTHDRGPKMLRDALMTEADAEDRNNRA